MERIIGKRKKGVFRCWVEVAIAFVFLGIVFVNSLYKGGYNTGWLAYASGQLVVASSGYEADGNSFQYTDGVDSYVQIANAQPSDQLLLCFGQDAAYDTEITVRYVNDQEVVTDVQSVGEWKAGKRYAKINIESGGYSAYQISIPADFTLDKVYYAAWNGFSRVKTVALYLAAVVIALVVSTLGVSLGFTRKIIDNIRAAVKRAFWGLVKNRKKAFLYAGICVAVFPAALLFTYVASRLGGFVFSFKLAAFIYLICLFGVTVACYWRLFKKKIEVFAFLTILIIGTAVSVFEPACLGISWDDETHYRNAVLLSHAFEGRISVSDQLILEDQPAVALEKKNYDRESQNQYYELVDVLEASDYYFDCGGFPSLNVAVAYLPSVIGLILGRGLGFPYHVVVVIGKWMNVLFLAVLSYLSMKRLKTGKLVVLLLALLPTNIFLAANYTYDIWLTGWSVYGLCAFFGELQRPEKKLGYTAALKIGIPLFLGVLPKLVYFPLIFIALFMPGRKFKSKKDCWCYRILILFATFLPFAVAYLQNIAGSRIGMGDTRGGTEVNASAQLQLIYQNPQSALKVLALYLKDYLNPWTNGLGYITQVAYLGYMPFDYRILLVVVIVAAFASRGEKEIGFPWWMKAGVVFEYVLIGFIAAFSMYVAYTPVGADTVMGCQARYMIPTLFPLLYVLSRFRGKPIIKRCIGEPILNIAPVAVLVIVTAWGFWSTCLAFY